jgi:hypothetical protein
MAVNDGFGGRARTLHTKEYPNLLGRMFQVSETKRVVTGTYYPPSGGDRSWYEESDWEPGGLTDQKHYKLVSLGYMAQNGYREMMWIQTENLGR